MASIWQGTEAGLESAALGVAKWRVPGRIRVRAGRLAPEGPPREVSAPRGLLSQFVALRAADDDQIAAFATRWGMLGLCREHARPLTHRDTGTPRGGSAAHPWCPQLPSGSERIADWRSWAARLGALVEFAAALRSGDAWQWIAGQLWPSWIAAPGAVDEATARGLLARQVGLYLEWGRVQPTLLWPAGDDPTIQLVARPVPGLFGALASELLATLAGGSDLALCSHCGSPYHPSRRPRADQRHFCPACRTARMPQRYAERAARTRARPPAQAV